VLFLQSFRVLQKFFMFIRENKNRSGSISIQIVSKSKGVYKVVKTVGCATDVRTLEKLKIQAQKTNRRVVRL
jgi:hypothetical protein